MIGWVWGSIGCGSVWWWCGVELNKVIVFWIFVVVVVMFFFFLRVKCNLWVVLWVWILCRSSWMLLCNVNWNFFIWVFELIGNWGMYLFCCLRMVVLMLLLWCMGCGMWLVCCWFWRRFMLCWSGGWRFWFWILIGVRMMVF